MQILIARHAGFCEGVERAHRIALEQAKSNNPVFMLGNLVHNKQVIAKFTKAGVKTVKSISEIPDNLNGTLLISAHGVSPQIYEEAKGKPKKLLNRKQRREVQLEVPADLRFIDFVRRYRAKCDTHSRLGMGTLSVLIYFLFDLQN